MINDIESLRTRCTQLEGKCAKLERQLGELFETVTAIVDHMTAQVESPPTVEQPDPRWRAAGERAPERAAIDAQLQQERA